MKFISSSQRQVIDRKLTTWVTAILLSLFWVGTARQVWRWDPAIDRWTTADWLINYRGGIVRRGFVGEVITLTTDTAQNAAYFVNTLQLLLLAFLYIVVYSLFKQTSKSPAWVMVVLSPAFLLFPYLSIQGGLRKEILVLVSLGFTGWVISRQMSPGWFIVCGAMFTVAAVSHETGFLIVPAFIYLFWWGHRAGSLAKGTAVACTAAWTASALIGLALSLIFRGSTQQARIICDYWISKGASPESCKGAIAALQGNLQTAITDVAAQFPSYALYALFLVLALLPLFLLKPPRSFWILTAISFIFALPLFLVAIDYGRWIYLVSAAMSIVALTTLQGFRHREVRIPLWLALAYILIWSLPYSGPIAMTPLASKAITEIKTSLINVAVDG